MLRVKTAISVHSSSLLQRSFSTKSLWDSQVIHEPLRQQNMFIWQAIDKLKDGTWDQQVTNMQQIDPSVEDTQSWWAS